MFARLNIYSKEYLTEASQVYLKNKNNPLISGVYIWPDANKNILMRKQFLRNISLKLISFFIFFLREGD